jgi:predicted enzyme related to lactoylglutathione lyase
MTPASPNPVVHLELHTGDLSGACSFYTRLCGWPSDRIETPSGSYRALDPGQGLSGGVVECRTPRPLWLPYVEVAEIAQATDRARALGASVLLDPREGPAGWRSVVAAPAGGEIAFWQPKR